MSPAVAVVRLSTAAVSKVSGARAERTDEPADARMRASDTDARMTDGSALRSVSGTVSAMAAAWGGSLKNSTKSLTVALLGLDTPTPAASRAPSSSDAKDEGSRPRTAKKASGSGRQVRGDGVVWKSVEDHVAAVRELARQVRARSPKQLVTTKRAVGASHCPRDTAYKDKALQLDLDELDAVLGVRQVEDGSWEMLVEPRVTMEQLVRAAAAYKLRPPVVPEFRRITVGGSIAGIAGESSSFAHGFFHDTCTGYEVITGDGSIVTATANNQYADLFYALPGTYGSLGVVTAATIRLLPTQPYVAMTYTHFDRVEDLVSYMAGAESRAGLDFVEGIGYSPSSLVACEGMEVSKDSAEAGVYGKIQRFNRFYSPWFFRNVQKKRGSMLRDPLSVREAIPLEEYLFRHDRGSFWMASYKMPSFIGRSLGFLLPSHRMYKMANALPQVFKKSEILLQDFMIPFPNLVSFVNRFCPLKNFGAPAPIFGVPSNLGDYCNVGAYGIPRRKVFEFEEDNKRMEMEMLRLDGRKVHYSHAYYPVDLFYSVIYDGDKYSLLRDKYKAEGAFPHVYEKIITKNGRL